MTISNQEVNQTSSVIVLKLSNTHPVSAVFVYDATVLLNHTRLDWRAFIDSIGVQERQLDEPLSLDEQDDDYSEDGSNKYGSEDNTAFNVDEFFPAHLLFDVKLVGPKGGHSSPLFIKLDPGQSYSLVYMVSLKEGGSSKVVKLPTTNFVTPCVVEWSHFEKKAEGSGTDGKSLSTLLMSQSFSWSCSSESISDDYRGFLQDTVRGRCGHQEMGLMEVAKVSNRNIIKVSIQGPDKAGDCRVGSLVELAVKMVNVGGGEVLKKLSFSYHHDHHKHLSPTVLRSDGDDFSQATSPPFIVHENSHIIKQLKAGQAATLKMTILPLRAGPLVLNGFILQYEHDGDGEEPRTLTLSLVHSFAMHIYE